MERLENDLSVASVLIFEDNDADAALLSDAITKRDHRVEIATSLTQARQHAESLNFSIAFVNLHLDDGSGLDFITSVKKQFPHFVCVAMTEQADFDTAVQAMRAGATDFVAKPIQTKALIQVLERCKGIYQIPPQLWPSDEVTARETLGLELQEQEESLAVIHNTMPISTALLNHEGVITFVNDAWRTIAFENGGNRDFQWVGQNYLEHAGSDAEGIQAAAGIRAVLSGEQVSFKHTYLCRLNETKYWFRMEVRKVSGSRPLTATVMHFDVTEIMKARRDVKESEQRFRFMVNAVTWGILTIDENGIIEGVNPAMQDIFGYTADEMIGENVSSLMSEPDRSQHDSYLANFAKTGEAKVVGIGREVTGQHKDGSLVPIQLMVNEVEINGRRGFTGIVLDISERKLAEDALRERETRMREIMDSSPYGISLMSRNSGKRLYANPRLVEMMGAESVEHLLSTPVDESFVDPADRPWAGDMIDHNGLIDELEVRRRRRDGSEWWSLMHCSVIDYGDEKIVISWLLDIDERKQAEQHLMDSEARLRLILDESPIAVSILSQKQNKRIFANQRMVEMLRAESREELLADEIIESYAVPQDYYNARNPDNPEQFEPESECLRLRKDGSELWCLITRRLIRYDGEDALFIWAYDITERRQMQQALVESEARFRDFASTASDWYWELDEKNRYTYISGRYQEVTGADPHERLGRTLEEAGIPGLSEEEFQRRLNVYRDQQPFRNHLHSRQRPDGTTVYLSISGRPVFDSEGCFKGYRGTGSDISDQIQTEHRVRESEQRFHMLASASSAGVFYIDANGKCLFVNEAFSAITGISSEGFKSTPWYQTIYHEDLNSFAEKWYLTVYTKSMFSAEFRFEHPDGSLTWAEINASPHRAANGNLLGYLGTAINIEEQKSIERELRDVEARAAAVLDNAPAAIYVKDTAGRYLQMNNRFKEIFDVDGNTLGKTDQELFNSQIADVLKKNDNIVLSSGALTSEEETIDLRNGSQVFLTSRIPLYNTGGEIYAVCAIATDITERKMTEAQLLHASKMASIGSMSAGIAHELSQPLHIMNLVADNKLIDLENGEASLADVHRSLETVSEQCRRMAQTILHMGVFSRIDDVEHEIFAVRPALIETITLLKQPFLAEGIAVKAELPRDCGHVLGHHSQFEQVIINLLTNARDAIKDSDAETICDIPEITLSCKPNLELQTVEISISDQGPGIPNRVMPRIFDPFYTTKEPGKGTGLGLAICMGIVNSMGGMMKAENISSGAKFTISLPLRNDEPASIEKQSLNLISANESSPIAAGHRILIVDDEETAASTLALHLRRLGYEVETANDGIEAFSRFTDKPTNLVVTDLRMPRMDGEELISKLRSENPDLPIVIITGDLDAGDLLKTIPGNGAVHLLRKPVILRDLYKHLEQLLKPIENSTGQSSK